MENTLTKNWPVPNEHDVYNKGDAEKIEYERKKLTIDIFLLEIFEGKWICSYEFQFKCGDFTGHGGPLYKKETYTSRDLALTSCIDCLYSSIVPIAEEGLDEQSKEAKKALPWLDTFGPDAKQEKKIPVLSTDMKVNPPVNKKHLENSLFVFDKESIVPPFQEYKSDKLRVTIELTQGKGDKWTALCEYVFATGNFQGGTIYHDTHNSNKKACEQSIIQIENFLNNFLRTWSDNPETSYNQRLETGKALTWIKDLKKKFPPEEVNILVQAPGEEARLSETEFNDLENCEKIIAKGLNTFVEVGNSLKKIHDEKLYREDYFTFDEYCKERWDFTDRYARNLISGSEVNENLKSGTIVPKILPQTESQARPLAKVKNPELQRQAWGKVEEAIETGKTLTAKLVQDKVNEVITDKKQVTEPEQPEPKQIDIYEAIEIAEKENTGVMPIIPVVEPEQKKVRTDAFSELNTHDFLYSAIKSVLNGQEAKRFLNGIHYEAFSSLDRNVILKPCYPDPNLNDWIDEFVTNSSENKIWQGFIILPLIPGQAFNQLSSICLSMCILNQKITFINHDQSFGQSYNAIVFYSGSHSREFEQAFRGLGSLWENHGIMGFSS
jgi:hypothetical protein